MLKKLLVLSVALIAVLANYEYAHTNAQQPPLSRTGAPGESTCAQSGCHGGAPIAKTGQITFNNNSLAYAANQTYDLKVQVKNDNSPSTAKYGFEMVALDPNGNSVGTFVTSSGTGIGTSGGKSYIFHKPAVTTPVYNFQWTAPNQNVGDITFYVATNSSNGDGIKTGDTVYTSNTKIEFATGINGITNQPQGEFMVFPNPLKTNSIFTLNYSLPTYTTYLQANLYNVQGQKINTLWEQKNPSLSAQQTLLLPQNLQAGVYYILLTDNNKLYNYQKVIILQ